MSRHGVPYPSDSMRFAAIEKDVHTLVTIAYFNMVLIGLLALLYVVR